MNPAIIRAKVSLNKDHIFTTCIYNPPMDNRTAKAPFSYLTCRSILFLINKSILTLYAIVA